MDQVLEDFEKADITPRLRETLRFLKKVTLTPHELTARDTEALRDAGVSKAAAHDAVKVALAFNLVDRLADSFEFEVPSTESFAKAAPKMIKFGYKM